MQFTLAQDPLQEQETESICSLTHVTNKHALLSGDPQPLPVQEAHFPHILLDGRLHAAPFYTCFFPLQNLENPPVIPENQSIL